MGCHDHRWAGSKVETSALGLLGALLLHSLSVAFGRLLEAAMAERRSKAELLVEFQMAGKNKIS